MSLEAVGDVVTLALVAVAVTLNAITLVVTRRLRRELAATHAVSNGHHAAQLVGRGQR